MEQTLNKQQASRLVWLCTFIYCVSYITRVNYGAVIAEMVTGTGLAKSALSVALTGNFITYGTGQLISGFFGDKFQPKKLVSLGLITTILMNLLIPLCNTPLQMTVVWCINGFAQAFMWPPLVKLMTSLLSSEDYARGCVKVSCGSSAGSIFVYLAAPLVITLSGWKGVFVLSALFGVAGLILWSRACPEIPMKVNSIRPAKTASTKIAFFSPLVLAIMLGIILQGILRDGVTTWMPSYIAETYHISNEISILTGIALPIFSMLAFQMTEKIHRKKLTHPMICSSVIFGVGAISACSLYLLSSANAALSVLFSALLTGCMHGVNFLLIGIMPPLLAKKENVSAMSGFLNSGTYIGSAISAYLIPFITEQSASWSTSLFMWFIIAALGTVTCLSCIPAWNHRSVKNMVIE